MRLRTSVEVELPRLYPTVRSTSTRVGESPTRSSGISPTARSTAAAAASITAGTAWRPHSPLRSGKPRSGLGRRGNAASFLVRTIRGECMPARATARRVRSDDCTSQRAAHRRCAASAGLTRHLGRFNRRVLRRQCTAFVFPRLERWLARAGALQRPGIEPALDDPGGRGRRGRDRSCRQNLVHGDFLKAARHYFWRRANRTTATTRTRATATSDCCHGRPSASSSSSSALRQRPLGIGRRTVGAGRPCRRASDVQGQGARRHRLRFTDGSGGNATGGVLDRGRRWLCGQQFRRRCGGDGRGFVPDRCTRREARRRTGQARWIDSFCNLAEVVERTR